MAEEQTYTQWVEANATLNRISILCAREHGDDEAYHDVAVFAAGEENTHIEIYREGLGLSRDQSNPETGEGWGDSGEYGQVLYINGEQEIVDGRIIERGDGRRFRIHIEELGPVYIGQRFRTLIAGCDTDENGNERQIPIGTTGVVERRNSETGDSWCISWENGGWTVWTAEELMRDAEEVN
jgi:hypothetical protein